MTILSEIADKIVERTGLSQDTATQAVDVVMGALKEKLPGPIASQLDGFLAGGSEGDSSIGSRLAGAAKSIFGSGGSQQDS